ncbi:hypothetical protein LSTR_LSTR009722 [Laodelphax striatellus]|uniref:UNC93-like protein MFSD11 n=1 Tax=Laodelphax striatellus TaxID=195883 RepID=A0A482WW50_LAOST|nr:hypothetical protein LSTR_LSTR009722 [Laodelphax striatellus]
MEFDQRVRNIVMLGLGFMGVFTAFQTTGLIQKTVLDSVEKDTGMHVDGYTLLAIVYIVFALSNWLTPSIVATIGPRLAMFLGGLTYVMYIIVFLHPTEVLLYVSAFVIGIGAAMIWTGQGNYLTINSDSTTIGRNSGIFWALLQCLELSFFSGIYSASLGFTLKFGEQAKELVAISGILIGVGEVLGGILFGLLGSKTASKGRSPIILIGFLVHVTAFVLININLPNDAPFKNTNASGVIEPIAWLALLCSFLLGLGDSCYNTQVMAMLGDMYKDNSAPAFAMFKFIQSTACGVCLLYSSRIGLYAQLAILDAFLIMGSICFALVEFWEKQSKRQIE